jgi:aminocarboxymuconate-semialdehyde decarboxylase
MKIVDSHFHWWPRSVFEALCKREGYPRAEKNSKGGYSYFRKDGGHPEGGKGRFNLGTDWFDLDQQLAHMDTTGYEISVVCSIGPFSLHFSDLPVEEGRAAAMLWNEEMAAAQRRYPGRVWATAAVPLRDTQVAIEVLDHAIGTLGLVGANLPGSVGSYGNIDEARLEPFYDRVEQLGIPLYIHPTDSTFPEVLDGYNGALYLSLGRVVDVSVTACRLILSGIMERHPALKIVMSHTGGALPYQAGRMDKNAKAAGLPQPPSTYIKRMYTDTVSPHEMGIRYAVEFYGVDHIMYGSDYPCWDPATALQLFTEVGLSKEDQQKILNDNARRILGLRDPL